MYSASPTGTDTNIYVSTESYLRSVMEEAAGLAELFQVPQGKSAAEHKHTFRICQLLASDMMECVAGFHVNLTLIIIPIL